MVTKEVFLLNTQESLEWRTQTPKRDESKLGGRSIKKRPAQLINEG